MDQNRRFSCPHQTRICLKSQRSPTIGRPMQIRPEGRSNQGAHPQ